VEGEAPRSMAIQSHLQRMSAYCALLGERLGVDADLLRVAGRLHDVGMAAVSATLVEKPGPLTAEERRELAEHTEVGHAMLTGSGVELLDTAAEIALTHHERWDGAGYPRRLAGEAIPLSGRIVAVADTWDALTTERPYRPTPPLDAAIDALRTERGRQLDARVVDALLDALDAALEIRERFPMPKREAEGAGSESGQMTLQAAAATLSISPSRLRRWADEGRIPAIRTPGGHRRFPRDAVRRLAAERGVRPLVRPVEPPTTPLPLLEQHLRRHGRQMAAAAAAAVYREGPPGWFASQTADGNVHDWVAELGQACATGAYAGALLASETLMRHAQQHAASLLERHAFLERFGQVAVRALVQAGAKRTEIASSRRLFTSLQQSLLEARD
jgi:excisionase family DNA binding protein